MGQQVGVIGGGQLAWMMAIAAKNLGIELSIQAASPEDSAVRVADRVVYGAVADAQATAKLAEVCPVITFENEFVDLVALQELLDRQNDHQNNLLFLPKLETLAIAVDKLKQRQHFRNHQIPTPEFYAVDDISQLLNAAERLGYPLVLKSRRHGYDGKGTSVIKNEMELRSAWEAMGTVPAIAEAFIPFECELAVIAARSQSGEIAIYPVVETIQANQVCRRTIAPARVSSLIAEQVKNIAKRIITTLDAVGVFGIEFFLTDTGEISVNEIAPRTHNSGHYTIEGCQTSQFEQLLRVVSGMALGDVSMRSPVALMVNLLGFEEVTWQQDFDITNLKSADYNSQDLSPQEIRYLDKLQKMAIFPNTHIHWYGKKQSKNGRKLGHVTVLADSHAIAIEISDRLERIWYDLPD